MNALPSFIVGGLALHGCSAWICHGQLYSQAGNTHPVSTVCYAGTASLLAIASCRSKYTCTPHRLGIFMMALPSDSSPASSRSPSPSMVDGSSVPLPPYRADTIHLTPYSQPSRYTPAAGGLQGTRPSWASLDPRSSSTQSLVPSESGEPGRRTLLLVYSHGFLGNETSFQSFPAHVHNLLKVTLAETHVVHTKIYPRYRSRKAIEFARDDFSAWYVPSLRLTRRDGRWCKHMISEQIADIFACLGCYHMSLK